MREEAAKRIARRFAFANISCRSTWPPSGILESLTWKTGTPLEANDAVDEFKSGG